MASFKGLITGAAFGCLIGSLAAIFYPRRHEIMDAMLDQANEFGERARGYAEGMLNKGNVFSRRRVIVRENYWKGGLAGLIAGTGLALLLAPKTGKQLRAQVSKAYQDAFDKTQEVVHVFQNSANPFQIRKAPARKRSAKTKAKSRR